MAVPLKHFQNEVDGRPVDPHQAASLSTVDDLYEEVRELTKAFVEFPEELYKAIAHLLLKDEDRCNRYYGTPLLRLEGAIESMIDYCEMPSKIPVAGNFLTEPNPKSLLCELVKKRPADDKPENWFMRYYG